MKDKHQSVCVDLDATLAHYKEYSTEIGIPLFGAKQFMEELHKDFYVIVFSFRAVEHEWSEEAVCSWLDENDIPFDEIYTGRGKPHATAYVDDRAVECRPQSDPDAYYNALKRIHLLSMEWTEEIERLLNKKD